MIPKTIDGNPIPCVSLSVNQSVIPLSNATMEVLTEDTLPIRTYVTITTPNGVTEIYRTRQPQTSHSSGMSTIQLDHAICEVGDYLVQDAINEELSVADAISTVFAYYRGDKWQLGSFDAPETVILDCDYDNLLETMLAILEQAPQYIMTFDFSTSPWTVSVAQKSNTVTAEGRMSRNIANDAVKTDDKDQCTRVYVKGLPKPSGREEDENAIGYMDADAETIAQYGIIEKETGSGNLTEEQATRIAQAYLAAHKLPKRSVELDGDDLSEITGETLDSFVCGKLFRLVVPEDNLVIEDYITKVTFQDAINSPTANVYIGDEQDATINFLQNQASSSKASRGARKKQDKLEEEFKKDFVELGEHGEILKQAGMKLDASGMLVYARDNVNNIGSILDITASQIMSQVEAGDLGLRSEIQQTASAIRLSVDNSLSDVHSSITQTADSIRSEVHASSSTVYSFINQTATYIQAVVEDVNNDLHSEILQTQSMIRSAVWTANSLVYSYVDQTASYILDHVGERTGAKVYTGTEEPVDSPDNPITPGDMWLDGNYINFWDDADFKFVSYDPEDPEYDWTQLRGAQLKVWKDGKWQVVEDGTTLVEDTEFRRTKDQINLVAYNLGKFDGELRSNIARLDVKADRIVSTVNERIADVGSSITQTAYQIRSEVHSAQSQLYSAIEQTATNIRSYVVDKINDVGSEIEQTADSIRSEVHAANSSVYSYIKQTATNIRSEVANVALGLNSSIEQTASQIRLEVNDKMGQVSSSITQTARQIRAEVNAANSKVYSSITQTASSIRAEVADSINGVSSSITQTATQIRAEVNAANSKVYSSITQTASSIRAEVADTISGVSSSITQTANQIRAEVNAANSRVYSSITQTASSIRAEVADSISGVNSSITQTANSIRSEVNAANSRVYSSITQTASSIRAEVANTISGVRSSITQTANQIRSEVNAANSKVYSSITQTASSIRAEVADSISGVNSSITQTASSIRQEVADTKSQLQGSITVQSNRISLVVEGTGTNAKIKPASIVTAINNDSSSVIISANRINLSGYVSATGLATAIANLSQAHINKLYVDTNIYAPNGLSIYGNGVWQLGLTRSGNTYTLTETKLNGDQRTVGTFSRAISTWSWGKGSGNNIKVTAQPQNQSISVDVRVSGDSTITANGTYTYKAQYEDDYGSYYDTGASKSVTVSLPYTPTACSLNPRKSTGVPSGYTLVHGNSSSAYYIKGSGTSATVRCYGYPIATIDGTEVNFLNYSGMYGYLYHAPSAAYQDGYSAGYDAGEDAGWYTGYDYDGSDHHAMKVYGNSHSTIYSGTVPMSRNQTIDVFPAFKKYRASGGSDSDYVWGSKVSFKAPSGTALTFTRGAYDSKSHTYTCTCTLSESVASKSSFTLYYMQ